MSGHKVIFPEVKLKAINEVFPMDDMSIPMENPLVVINDRMVDLIGVPYLVVTPEERRSIEEEAFFDLLESSEEEFLSAYVHMNVDPSQITPTIMSVVSNKEIDEYHRNWMISCLIDYDRYLSDMFDQYASNETPLSTFEPIEVKIDDQVIYLIRMNKSFDQEVNKILSEAGVSTLLKFDVYPQDPFLIVPTGTIDEADLLPDGNLKKVEVTPDSFKILVAKDEPTLLDNLKAYVSEEISRWKHSDNRFVNVMMTPYEYDEAGHLNRDTGERMTEQYSVGVLVLTTKYKYAPDSMEMVDSKAVH